MPEKVILQFRDLVKRFGNFTALDGVDLDVYDGEFLTVVGPSGSGKTTLIRQLVGMDVPTEGTIHLNGEVINEVPPEHRPTCMVFQSLALFPHLKVGQNIEFPLKVRGVSSFERRKRAMELLELLHLPTEYYGRRVSQCSGGERQRVALARALAFDPEILFFDEPLSALDARLRKTLQKELKDLQRRTGKTFVYITHSLEEAMVMSDRIAILRHGRIEQIGTAEEIYSLPKTCFAAEFMGDVNLFDVQGDDGRIVQASLKQLEINADTVELMPGQRATLMVRPESVRFLSGDETADCVARGTLDDTFELGSRIQYKIAVDDDVSVTVEKLRKDRFSGSIDDPVTLGWSLADCHLIHDERMES